MNSLLNDLVGDLFTVIEERKEARLLKASHEKPQIRWVAPETLRYYRDGRTATFGIDKQPASGGKCEMNPLDTIWWDDDPKGPTLSASDQAQLATCLKRLLGQIPKVRCIPETSLT